MFHRESGVLKTTYAADMALYPLPIADRARARWLEEFADTRMGEVFIWRLFNQVAIRPGVWGEQGDQELVARTLAADVPQVLDYLEGELPADGFLFGAVSVADVAIATFFRNAAFARFTVDVARWPKTAAFVGRVLGLEEFARLQPFEERCIRTPVAKHRDVLAELGYARDTYSQGVGCEVNLTKQDRFGLDHVLDVHWRLSGNEVFAALFDWEEAHRMSVAVPALAVQARGLSPVHALLHACVHRAAHVHSPYYVDGDPYLERNRLIWLYDIRLLSDALDTAHWRSFVDLARERGVSALCLDALHAAADLLGAAIPTEASSALAHPKRSEISAQLLLDSAWRGAWVEFRAQRGLAARSKYLRDLLFPNRQYMQRKYPKQPAWLLPYLYLRRVLEGVHRRLRHFR